MPLCVLRVHFDSPGSDTAVRFGHLVYKTVPGNYFVHIKLVQQYNGFGRKTSLALLEMRIRTSRTKRRAVY